MASSTKFTVTHPDGTVSKRTSKTMIYTHAIQVSPADPYILAEHLRQAATTADRMASKLTDAADVGTITIRSRGFNGGDRDDLHSHQATLLGTDSKVYTWCSRDGMTKTYPNPYPAEAVLVHVDIALRADARKQATSYAESATKLRAEADAILAAGAPVGTWTVERWSTRQDLALKAVGSFRYLQERGHRVTVVAVDAPKTDPAPVPTEADVAAMTSDPRAWVASLAGPDPSEDCADTCCVEAAAQDVERGDLGTLTEEDQVPTLDREAQERADFQARNPDAVIRFHQGLTDVGGWRVTCKGGPVCARFVSDWHPTERLARRAYAIHRAGQHAPAGRIQTGDIVTIHRGTMLREVLDVKEDMVRVVPLDPDDLTDPWWTGVDLVHRAAPVPVSWGQVLEVGGQLYALMSDGEAPYLKPIRS